MTNACPTQCRARHTYIVSVAGELLYQFSNGNRKYVYEELENMEQLILEAEAKIEKLQEELVGEEDNLEHYKLMGQAQEELDALYQRWQNLLDRSK